MNKEEFNKLIEAHYRANYKRLLKEMKKRGLSHHIAEEAIQETYVKCLECYRMWDDTSAFNPWFFSALINCVKDKWKEERHHGMTDPHDYMDATPVALNRLILRDVEKMVDEQKEKIKPILKLFFFQQFTIKDISKFVPQSCSNIGVVIHRFRMALKKRFKGPIFERM